VATDKDFNRPGKLIDRATGKYATPVDELPRVTPCAEDVTISISRIAHPPSVVLRTSRARRPVLIPVANVQTFIDALTRALNGKVPGAYGSVVATISEAP
jgi:hypothetical protein